MPVSPGRPEEERSRAEVARSGANRPNPIIIRHTASAGDGFLAEFVYVFWTTCDRAALRMDRGASQDFGPVPPSL